MATQSTDPTDPDAPQDQHQDQQQDQGPAMDDAQVDATGRLADEVDPVTSDGSED